MEQLSTQFLYAISWHATIFYTSQFKRLRPKSDDGYLLIRIVGMKINELKGCLPLCRQKTTGRKEELVARVLFVFETDFVLTKTAEEVEREIVSD